MPVNAPLSSEITSLRRAYAALNANDLSAFLAIFDDNIERVEPPGFPLSGTYRGLPALTAHVTKARASWAEGACTPERFLALPATNRVVVSCRVHVRLTTEPNFRDGLVTDVFTFRNGKATEYRSYANEREALEWAGINPPGDP